METFPEQLEQFEHQRDLPAPEHHQELPANAQAATPEKHPGEALSEVRKHVVEALEVNDALSPKERLETAEKAPEAPSRAYVNQELRQLTEHRMERRLQRQEPPLQRQFSRLIHQPVVRAVSDAASQTVSRPSGLLGGGLLALVGTSGYLYLAKHIGFAYNYGVFALLFVGGFALGLILELAVHLFTKRTLE